MNAEHTEQLKAAIRKTPMQYDQGVYWEVNTSKRRTFKETVSRVMCGLPPEPCGTACCLAGWSYVLGHGVDINDDTARRQAGGCIVFAAQDWLELDNSQAQVLFSNAEEWPSQFGKDFDTLARPAQVERACSFLDWLLAGNDVLDESLYEREDEEDPDIDWP